MDLGKVIGRATSTIKHPTFAGWRLIVVQPVGAGGRADGDPVVALDALGCQRGDEVILTSDGPAVRAMLKADNSPARWAIMGLKDA